MVIGIAPDQKKVGKDEPEQILASTNFITFDGTLASDIGYIEPGTCVGQQDSSLLYEPVIKAKVAEDADVGDDEVIVTSLYGIEAGDDLIFSYKDEDDEETIEVDEIVEAENKVVLVSALDNDQVEGVSIRVDDGTQDAVGIYAGTQKISTKDRKAIFPLTVQAAVEEDRLKSFDDVVKEDLENSFIFV